MGICKNCRTTPLLKALNLSHIPNIVACFNLKLLNTVMKRNFAARQFNLLMIKATVLYNHVKKICKNNDSQFIQI